VFKVFKVKNTCFFQPKEYNLFCIFVPFVGVREGALKEEIMLPLKRGTDDGKV